MDRVDGEAIGGTLLTALAPVPVSRAVLRALVDTAADAMVTIDSQQRIMLFNRAAEIMFGWPAAEALGKPLSVLIPPESAAAHGELVKDFTGGADTWRRMADSRPLLSGLRKDGRRFPAEVTISKVLLDGRWYSTAVVRDVGERQHLKALSKRDALTGLPNRAVLADHSSALLARARPQQAAAVLFIDVDNFKRINDTAGQAVGDEFLVAFGNRLAGAVRQQDLLVRFGADQFVVLAELPFADEGTLRILGERLRACWDEPFTVSGRQVRASATIGAAMEAVRSGITPESLVARAETALRQARVSCRDCVAVYDDAVAATARDAETLVQGLEHALARGEMYVAYQPIVRLDGDQATGYEALLRWNHDGRLIPPDRFIPLAEEAGLIHELGRWVLARACAQAQALSVARGVPVGIGVNLSPRQLVRPDMLDTAVDVLRRTGLPPHQLTLEITETALLDPGLAEANLRALHQHGIRIALDDFGTGFSSLSYLRRFPLTTLKIDKSFVAGVGTPDSPDTSIVAATIGLAHALGLDVVAEGIETADQARILASLGADRGQGYLYGRPATLEQRTAGPGPGRPLPVARSGPA